eukprot:NODE_589_length_1459_cov_167.338319.p1 GENE.NODE_589_length_1459_cov_167.338319~~NODE_589_length_1459_cov_167.338319.p1  ORF type:complete len:466 (+),score=102.11 NODE_589_length_1459_cov_167.338319:3-1400(+)
MGKGRSALPSALPICGACGGAAGEHLCQICNQRVCEACAPNTVWLPSWRSAQRVCQHCVSVIEWGPPLHSRLREVGESLHTLGTASPKPLKIRHGNFVDVIDFCEGALPALQDLRATFDLLVEAVLDLSQRISALLGPPRDVACGPAEVVTACIEDIEQLSCKLSEMRAQQRQLKGELASVTAHRQEAEHNLALERENCARLEVNCREIEARAATQAATAANSGSHCSKRAATMRDERAVSPTRSATPPSTPRDRHPAVHGIFEAIRRGSRDSNDQHDDCSPHNTAGSPARSLSPKRCLSDDHTPQGDGGGEKCAACDAAPPPRILGRHITCGICRKTICKKCAPNHVELEGHKHPQKACRACIGVAITAPLLTARVLGMLPRLHALSKVFDQPTMASSLDEAIHLCECALAPPNARSTTLSDATFSFSLFGGGHSAPSSPGSPKRARPPFECSLNEDLEVTFRN